MRGRRKSRIIGPVTGPHPSTHGTAVHRPADFEAFWDETLAILASSPVDVHFEHDRLRSTPEVDVYDVHYTSYQNVRIAAWYCRPAGARGALPAIIHVPGYVSEPAIPKGSARDGFAALSLAPRGKLRSHGQFNPGYPGLLTENIVDHRTYGYRGFYCDAIRAMDVIFTRPEIDPGRVAVAGSSQGGALALLVAAMRPETRCAVVGAPYLTGMIDAIALTHSYPYQEINDYLRQFPERRESAARTLAYYDLINFAPRIVCPVLINIGLRDDVCPPETGYAVFDALRCPKELHPYEDCAHDAGGQWHGAVSRAFLSRHLRGPT